MSGAKRLPPDGALKEQPVPGLRGSDFDLSATFDPYLKRQEEGVEVEINHPDTGKGLGVFVRVAGPDSKRALKAARDAVTARVTSGRRDLITGDEAAAEQINQLAARVMSWRTTGVGDVIVHNGRKLDPTHENVAAVLRKYPPILAQVSLAAAGEVGAPGFTKAPPPPSEEPSGQS